MSPKRRSAEQRQARVPTDYMSAAPKTHKITRPRDSLYVNQSSGHCSDPARLLRVDPCGATSALSLRGTATRQIFRFPGFQIPRHPGVILLRSCGIGGARDACVGTWKSGILKTCRPARLRAAPLARALQSRVESPRSGPLRGSRAAGMAPLMAPSRVAPGATLGHSGGGGAGRTSASLIK
jgi:hypothetical protein